MQLPGPVSALQAMLAVPQAGRVLSGRAAPLPETMPPASAESAIQAQPQAAPSVQMLVALAAAAPLSAERRRRSVKQAEAGLDGLEHLHADLVSGEVPARRLEALRAWTRERGRPDEPELAELMDEIELRILVELAKREAPRG